jgi:hypothetical protein
MIPFSKYIAAGPQPWWLLAATLLACGSAAAQETGGSSAVDAGPERFLVLPQTATVLDGTVESGQGSQWTQVEGPTAATIATPGQADTSVAGLAAGYYVFELSAGDSDRVAVLVADPGGDGATVAGTQRKWHPVRLDFSGPVFAESDVDPNPFVDRRLELWLRAPDGRVLRRPGFFDGDGSGSGTGNVWRVRVSPDQAGTWHYVADFRSGANVGVSPGRAPGLAAGFGGASGSFEVGALDPDAPGFLSRGRLAYVGGHYLKFADGDYWIKGGTDSPENFLGYGGFDNTIDQGNLPPGGDFLHAYEPHVDDWASGDPDWGGGAGRGIVGALNYLASVGVNSIYFLPMNLGGDGRDAYPFVAPGGSAFDNTHYDISKLAQWNTVFEHAQRRGIALHFVLNETESGNENWLDNGTLGTERRLFYRELVARFGHHLALKWNLSEENDFPVARLRSFADYIGALDSEDHPITVHTKPDDFSDYDDLLGDERFSATSIQYDPDRAGDHVETWRSNSAAAGRPWVLDMDENNPPGTGLTDANADALRKRVLYDVYFSGGNIEWYAGYHPRPPDDIVGDITLEDFRTREAMWTAMTCAREFMADHLAFWRMAPADDLLSGESGDYGGGEVFAETGSFTSDRFAIYLPNATATGALDLAGSPGDFEQRWFDPRACAFVGDAIAVSGGGSVALGPAPGSPGQDWVVLFEQTSGPVGVFRDRFEAATNDP